MARRSLGARPLYVGIRVRNLDRSIRFYKALGLRPTLRRRTSLGEFVLLEHPFRRFTIELNQYRPGSSNHKPYRSGAEMDHFGFWVDDVDRWVARLIKAGGREKWTPYDAIWPVPPGWPIPAQRRFKGQGAYVLDPDGIYIELMGARKRTRPGRAPLIR